MPIRILFANVEEKISPKISSKYHQEYLKENYSKQNQNGFIWNQIDNLGGAKMPQKS